MFRDPVSFKDDVLATVVAQVIAHGQPGLAATDDERLDVFVHRARSVLRGHGHTLAGADAVGQDLVVDSE